MGRHFFRPVRGSQNFSSDQDHSELLTDALNTLLNGDELVTHVATHSMSDVMQRLHDNADDSTSLESALVSLNTADLNGIDFLVAKIRELQRRTANEYIDEIAAELIEAKSVSRAQEAAEMLVEQREMDRDYHL
jgi:hypothetical protein